MLAKDRCASCYRQYQLVNSPVKASCHPERGHVARGLCKPCYRQWDKQRKQQLRATCHPDKQLHAKGLCSTCYKTTRPDQYPNRLRARYGITESFVYDLAEKQNWKCGICQCEITRGTWFIDHCHITNKVRGLLCLHCNTGLGSFKDNIASLTSAISYLLTTREVAQ